MGVSLILRLREHENGILSRDYDQRDYFPKPDGWEWDVDFDVPKIWRERPEEEIYVIPLGTTCRCI
jgi:hypothetical protein